MRTRQISLALLTLFFGPALSFALPSRITAVSVYADRAEITRSSGATVQKGEVELVLEGLPASLDNQSVQVWGTGGAQATLEGVSVEMEPAPEVPEGKVAELKAKIQQLNDRREVLNQKRRAIDSRIWLLGSIKPEGPRGDAAPSWGNIAELEQIVSNIVAGLKAAYAEQRAIDAELRRLGKELSALNSELYRIQSPSGGRTKRVVVNLTVTRPGSMDIGFSYIVPGATWRPLYDVRALPDQGQVEITSHAEIVQRTGEDWNDVALSVSTAKPHVGGTPPKPEPIYLFFYTPPPPAQPVMAMPPPAPPPPGAGAMAADTEAEEYAEAMPEEAPAIVEAAEVKTAGTAVFFEVKQRKTIPSDGEPHRVPLAVDMLKTEFAHASWPEARAFAFLRGKVTNTSDHPFVGGAANVFVESSFIGTSRIEDWALNEEKIISLGVDQGVRIERRLITRDEKESGSKTAITYEYMIEIKNFKPKAIKLELFDRIPISRQGDIEIKPGDILPVPAKQSDDGILKWELSINPGQTTEVRLSYTVRFPKGSVVSGLP